MLTGSIELVIDIGCCPEGCIITGGPDMLTGAFELPKPDGSFAALVPAWPLGLPGLTEWFPFRSPVPPESFEHAASTTHANHT
jgi:hypothetical protein